MKNFFPIGNQGFKCPKCNRIIAANNFTGECKCGFAENENEDYCCTARASKAFRISAKYDTLLNCVIHISNNIPEQFHEDFLDMSMQPLLDYGFTHCNGSVMYIEELNKNYCTLTFISFM